MGIFDKFKKNKAASPAVKDSGISSQQKPAADKKEAGPKKEVNKVVKERAEKPDKKTVKKVSKEDTGQAYRVLIKPVMTEKSTFLGEQSKYVFEVSQRANKIMVKQAIKAVYGVDPVKVNITKVKGKQIRVGRRTGKRKDWKKAVVNLKKGQKIEVFEAI
ncbi:MAG TPA: 50S ribosomal protein L23 [Patescibacteria group bacterium]